MDKKIQQNQIFIAKKFLHEGKIELGVKLANELIINKIKPFELSKFIKKALIKNKIIGKHITISKLENLYFEKKFTCAKYYFQYNFKVFSKNSKTLFLAAKIYTELNELDDAKIFYEKALSLNPNNLNLIKEIAIFYMTIGDLNNAIIHFNFLKNKNPTDGDNHRLLSRTKKYNSPNDAHIVMMENLILNQNLNLEQRINIYFALGNVFENLKLYNKSAKFYQLGNKEQNRRLNFNFNKEKHMAEIITNMFTEKKIREIQTFVKSNNKPIFILGMPRSGTSLVEQILSSHKDVYGGGELSFIEDYIIKNRGSISLRMPEVLTNPKEDNILSFYNYYEEKLNYLNFSIKHITDKMPGNFKWIGLIKSAFPDSKIIHVKRDKKDTCFSIYKSYFANNTCSYAYDLGNIVKYFNLYENTMKKWNNILGKEIYECSYENLVYNFENEVKKLLDFCKINWDKSVLNYFNNKRRVLTVSSAQIRESVYKSSINSWLNYKKDLEKHFEKLV